jgi:two-component system CheB/CheR fusion protein
MRSSLARYLMAVLAVAVALTLRLLLIPITGTGAPYVVFFAAVLLTSLYAGFGPGLLAVALAAPLGAYAFITRAGYPVDEAVAQALLFAVDGVLVAYLSYLITRSRRAADAAVAALQRSEEELRRSDRHKDEFLAMLSHELRNPLSAIRNSVYVLMRSAPDAEASKRAREVVDRQSIQLTRLVDDLLDLTRIARGKLELRLQPVELGDLMRRAIEDQRSFFDARGIVLEEHVPSAAAWVEGDSARLVQVVQNLLSNAVKFTPPERRVAVSLESVGDEATLRVRDSGVGIAAKDLPRVFEPFVQVGAAGRAQGGLGLGLTLVKGIVEQHGGTVDVASSPAIAGAEFVVRLPLRAAPAPLPSSAAPCSSF